MREPLDDPHFLVPNQMGNWCKYNQPYLLWILSSLYKFSGLWVLDSWNERDVVQLGVHVGRPTFRIFQLIAFYIERFLVLQNIVSSCNDLIISMPTHFLALVNQVIHIFSTSADLSFTSVSSPGSGLRPPFSRSILLSTLITLRRVHHCNDWFDQLTVEIVSGRVTHKVPCRVRGYHVVVGNSRIQESAHLQTPENKSGGNRWGIMVIWEGIYVLWKLVCIQTKSSAVETFDLRVCQLL